MFQLKMKALQSTHIFADGITSFHRIWTKKVLQEKGREVVRKPQVTLLTSKRTTKLAESRFQCSTNFASITLRVPTSHPSTSQRRLITSRSSLQYEQVRSFAGGGGSRGSRGHGWYVNYRAGDKGGRHLRGEYYDREDVKQCSEWNEAILKIGSTCVYLDIVIEPRNYDSPTGRQRNREDLESLTGEKVRLTMDIASTVMPETTKNFIDLCNADFIGSKLYRIEKKVGLFGGDILTNTGRSGKAAFPQSTDIDLPGLRLDIHDDPLVMWHIPGTISMLVPKVGCIDSRFMICTETARHIDGIHRAFGQLSTSSCRIVQDWTSTLITYKGVPTSYDLIIADCGILSTNVASEKVDYKEGDTISAAG